MPKNQTIDRVIDGVRDNSNVWIDLLRAGNSQMYRLNRLVIDEVDRTQQETAELVRTWAGAPADVSGFTNELFATLTRRVRRRMELGRTLIDDLRDMGAGTRSLWERMTDANRQTARATARAGREAISEAARGASNVAESVSDTAEDVADELRQGASKADPRNN
jgi:methyl-accepting chemotaxis protein